MRIQHGGAVLIKVTSPLIYLFPFILSSSLHAQTSETVIHEDEFVKGIYHSVTTTKQGETTTTVTVTYEEKIVNGKKVQKKMRTEKEVTNEKYHQTTISDTMFDQFGAAAAAITEHRYSDSVWIYTEKKQFNLSGQIISGEKYEVGFDNVTKEFPVDKKTGEFSTGGTPISRDKEIDLMENRASEGYREYEKDDGNFHLYPKSNGKPTACAVPKFQLSVDYAFLHRDNEPEKINMNGPQITLLWLYSNNSDTTYIPGQKEKWSIGLGFSAINVVHKDGEITYTLASVTAGPVIRLNLSPELAANLNAQAGVAVDKFKFDDFKESNSEFALKFGVDLEWSFSKKFGVGISPQVLHTKLNDESKWLFAASAGIFMKMGCR